jgi:hypothetical protein
LHQVDTSRGRGHFGVYLPRPDAWFAGPRGGRWFYLLLGLAALGVLAFVCWQLAPRANRPVVLACAQAGLAALAALALLVGLARFRRPKPRWPLRTFLYADALHLWDVTPDRVVAVPLERLRRAAGMHRFADESYASSRVVLLFPGGRRDCHPAEEAQAERLLDFLNGLVALRTSEDGRVRLWAAASPGRLAAAACRLARRGGGADLADLPEAPDPPEPYRVPPDPAAARPGWRGTAARVACAAAVAAAGVAAFPGLNDYLRDEYLFARIPARDNGGGEELDRYLAAFPGGRHAPAVRELRDDRRFTRAEREAQGSGSPAGLRAYLADPADQRHRADAQRLIAGHYDRAIAALKTKRDAEPGKIDRDLFEGVLALLDALKRADGPVVTVGFRATLDPEPTTQGQKALEKMVYDAHLRRTPELRGIAERQPDRSAILPCGQVFDPGQTSRREEVILGRLRDAVARGINADVLTLEPAAAGATPVMEVAYHIHAAGALGLYSDTDKKPKGLLRWYAINWTITIRPPGEPKAFVYDLASEPGLNLTYDEEPGDPSWAVYAVVLYSGFYDMSARLIRNFGLDPGPAPNAFTFGAVARNRPDEPPPLWAPKGVAP